MDIQKLLQFSVHQQASDLHISAGLPPMIRVNGEIRPIKVPVLDQSRLESLLSSIMGDAQHTAFAQSHDLDFALALPSLGRFRVNVFQQHRGLAAVFRTIPEQVPSLQALNAPPILQRICQESSGLVLVTGATGSGKSTTLAAMIDAINASQSKHILTIEDPLEFIHQPKKCLINQRELGRDTCSFSTALRAALREDPDILLIGELRDVETIRLALTAAETGHLVFATLHTSSAAQTINRMIDVFPAAEKAMIRSMLSISLRAVIAQTLLKKLSGGRIAAHEILRSTPAVRNLIREDKVAQLYSTIQTGQAHGMQTLAQAIQSLVQQGIITQPDLVGH
jgi:twitching motility protein PilT